MSRKHTMSRRDFLKRFASTTLAGAGTYATLGSLGMMNAMAADTSGYKALVCVFLYGGNDGFNMIVPRSNAEYNEYATARQNLALPSNDLLPINPNASDGVEYGLHPSMSHIQNLFEAGALGIISNVGALITPTTRNDYITSGHPLPPRLFSHNDQQDFWQSLKTDVVQPVGWAGRMADLLHSANANPRLSMNISLSGSNLLQKGNETTPYFMSRNGVIPVRGLESSSQNAQTQRRISAFNALLQNNPEHLFGTEYASIKRSGIDLSQEITDALAASTPVTTTFPAENNLATALKTVANTIAARNQLGLSRQIFFIGVGGWDTHGNHLSQHSRLLGQISEALSAFYAATGELGLENQITTFTASDFGRTLTSNGDGTDHGWGSHQLVMGGAVKGKDIYGEMPPLIIEGPQDSGRRGRIIPTISVDQYVATLAHWFGLTQNETLEIFPNLNNFSTVDLGFMA